MQTLSIEDTKLIKTLTENRGYASPRMLAVVEPLFGLDRTTDPAYDHVAWGNDGILMGIPKGHLGYDAFIGWCDKPNFERNLRGLNSHVGGSAKEADLLVEYAFSQKCG